MPTSLLLLLVVLGPLAAPAGWPGFRGAMSGLALDARLPDKWSRTENVTWSTDVPGQGWSSPIVWNGTVFVTSGISGRPFKQPSSGIYGNDYIAELQQQGLSQAEIMNRVRARDNEISEESGPIKYMLYAFDAATGKQKWSRLAHEAVPSGGRHRKNTYASETPVTDGERLYVSFGQNIGLFCYTLDGTLLWKRQWPPQPIYLDFGTAASPVVHNGRVYLLQDNEGRGETAFLTALDAKTGADVWRTLRTDRGGRGSGWSTPFIWQNSRRTEIVTTGRGFVMSYDLDGKELWRIGRMGQATPTAVASGDVVYVGTGAQTGDANRPFYAVKAGASGDITPAAGTTSNGFVLWSHPRAAGYTPSALVHDGRVYLVHDLGTMLVLAADSGREIYRARVGGVGHTFAASPIATKDRIYFPDEEGVTVVIEPSDEYKEVAKNDLGELTLASPAVLGNAMFIRTMTRLYRVEDR
jgi:outer membrane protein assembly factor BamB